MKASILTLSILISGSLSFAGALKTSDFNDMIQENQKSEALLRDDLQKEAGIRLDQEKPGTIAKDKLQIHGETQEIVSSSKSFWKERKDQSRKAQDKADMKRISQELDEASSN